MTNTMQSMSEAIKTGNLEQAKLSELKNRKALLVQKKEEISQRHAIGPEIVRFLDDLNIMMLMADYRKECTMKAHVSYDKILDRYSDVLGVSKDALKHLDVDEIIANLASPEKINDLYNQRTGLMLNGVENHRKFSDLGSRAEEFKEMIADNEDSLTIKGMVASKGPNPITTAKIKRLFTPADLGKVEDGDIVVSPMTTPQFTSALRKAIAVITDEGGITCHAAIISRELGLPCIIGTKNSSKRLKDGDIVEINTDKGIINIISRTGA